MSNDTDYYNYSGEDDDPHTVFNWNELLPTIVVYGITFILGLSGNILIIFTTFKYRRMQSVTNVFLSSLASSDLLLIMFCIPVKVAKLFSYTWEMGAVICKSVHYMQNVSTICSVLTLTAISIERYYAIVHPMKAKYICTISQAKRIILLIWGLSLLLATPTLKVQIHLPVGLNNEYRWCVRNWDNQPIWRFHELYMLILILVLPFCIMTFSYSLICWEIWKVMERRSVMTSEYALTRNYAIVVNGKGVENFVVTEKKKPKVRNGRDDTHMVKQVICMLVVVVALFAVCWAPLLIDNLLMAYDVLPYLRIGPLKHMSIAFSLMAYFNSCINPIVYGFMSKSFRESFVLAVCFSSDIKSGHRESSYSLKYLSRRGSQTRSTSIR
ncbi:pyroglutamylated RFamide peptide receptor-like [Anoplophora glabripennis]|uniref:pyroglutamylated RFamide peptide receptor-like n=1 Tax=Anoplophora glabripennis TaxID=217634 RepID=UPI00087425D8|nr:pyroglutamylated RFamide peptide receptor-like [Anoplophora glabripennis]